MMSLKLEKSLFRMVNTFRVSILAETLAVSGLIVAGYCFQIAVPHKKIEMSINLAV